VAVTIVDLGIDWSEIEPLRDLRGRAAGGVASIAAGDG
jgi:hypothetical protein